MGSLREPRSKRRKAGAPRKQMSAQTAYTCLRGAQPRPTHRQTATFVDAARHMVGMRLSALRLPFIAGGESIGFVVGEARARKRVARMISFIRPRALARGPLCGAG
jgi:hypothetical protein